MEKSEKKSGGVPRFAGIALLAASGAALLIESVRILSGSGHHIRAGLAMLGTVCLPLLAGTVLLTRSFEDPVQKRRVVRSVLKAVFGCYIVMLLAALFLGRVDIGDYAAHRAYYLENLELMTNFTPLSTIRLYIRCLIYDYIGVGIPLSNLVGNMVLFMPMAVLLPCLFKEMRTFWKFLLLMLGVLVAVEALQLLLCCGSCDVDDVILNLSGTLLVYGLIFLPPVRRLLVRLYLLPEEAPVSAADGETAPTGETGGEANVKE